MRAFADLSQLQNAVGDDLGPSDWIEITQDVVNRFGEVTGSDDWIHTDPERANAGPFGGPIAQGDLLVSMIPRQLSRLYELQGRFVGMIYGSDKVRFPSSAPVGARVRIRGTIAEVSRRGADVVVRLSTSVEVENHSRPAVVADVIHLYRPTDGEAAHG